MTNNKPFSQACENNKQPILQIIRRVFNQPQTVWEIGSGTGQHACYFARQLPHIEWQPTDREENLAGISLWVEECELSNIKPAIKLDVSDQPWPSIRMDAIFTANTLHIMSWREVLVLFATLGEVLDPGAKLCIYGPFNYNDSYTSDSNRQFDLWLKTRDPESGIRDLQAVKQLAGTVDITLLADNPMPANNRLLVWVKL